MALIIPPPLARLIQAHIDAYPALSPGYASYELLVRHYRALPIASDMWALILITPGGEIFSVDDSAAYEATVLDESKLICAPLPPWSATTMINLTGRRTFPELAAALPPRPVDAPDCPHCGGTGFIHSANAISHDGSWPCWPCGSLG